MLANGMKILVKEDHRAPVVATMVWYRAGSMDEVSGTTGVAHVLEHMMFKGTRDLAAGRIFPHSSRAPAGATMRSPSRTPPSITSSCTSRSSALALRLEADRMANLVLSAEEFAREIKVVMEERRLRTDDQPKALVYEAFMATAL